MRVASKVENLSSNFGHARPLGFRIIRYIRTDRQTDRQTDGRTDKSNAYCPLPYGGEGIKYVQIVIRSELIIHNNRQLRYNTIRYGVFNVQ